MAIRSIRILGDPILRTKCETIKKITPDIKSLIDDLLETVDLDGRAGLAANQIGVSLRAFSYNIDGKIGYIINPVMKELSKETQYTEEGCLSLPELSYKSIRSNYAKVEGVNLEDKKIILEGFGLMAKCIQHEVGHLNGQLYIDILKNEEKKQALSDIRNILHYG